MAKTQTIPVRIPPDKYPALQSFAKEQRRTVSEVIRIALEEYLERNGVTISLALERDYQPKEAD